MKDAEKRIDINYKHFKLFKGGTMKSKSLILIICIFLLGCNYESPVPSKNDIPIDKELLGLWQFDPEFESAEIRISANGETEYLLTSPIDGDSFQAKVYHVKIGDIDALQVQFLGTEDLPLDENQYNLAVIEKQDNTLIVKFLNDYLISTSIKTGRELKEQILAHKDNKELFHIPVLRLTKIE